MEVLLFCLISSMSFTLVDGNLVNYTKDGNETANYSESWLGQTKNQAFILGLFLLVNCVFSILGNLLVLISFYSQRPCRKPLRVLLMNLAVSNLIVATLGEPMVTVSALAGSWQFGEGGRKFEAFLVTVGGLFSMVDLAVISVERLLRVTLVQRTIFTDHRTPAICTGIWIFQIIFCFIPFFGVCDWVAEGIGISNTLTWDTGRIADIVYILIMISVGYFGPLFVICICYARIFVFVKGVVTKDVTADDIEFYRSLKTKSKIFGSSQQTASTTPMNKATTDPGIENKEQGTSQEQGTIVSTNITGSTDQGDTSTMENKASVSFTEDPAVESKMIDRVVRAKTAERQMATIVGIIIISFFVSWTPYAVANVLVTFKRSHTASETIYATLPALFAKTSTVWSPIIYFFMDNEIKSSCMIVLKRMRRWIRVVYFGGPKFSRDP